MASKSKSRSKRDVKSATIAPTPTAEVTAETAAVASPTPAVEQRKYKSKSDAIRQYLKANPLAKTKEVQDALKQQGVEFHPSHVDNVRNQLKAGEELIEYDTLGHGGSGADTFVSQLLAVKKFVTCMGNADRAIRAIRALKHLTTT